MTDKETDNRIAPIVSVVVPVYNSENVLRETLESILGQTLREIEVICVDDGSTDRSLEIMREYAAKDPRLIILSQPHANAGAARNIGLSRARGIYLSFLDSDDLFESDMLEKAYAEARWTDADIVAYRCDFYLSEMDLYEDATWTIQKDLLPSHRPFSLTDVENNAFLLFNSWAWDKLFRRDFVLKNNLQFQEQRTTNDLYFVLSAVVAAKRISVLDNVFVHQRIKSRSSLNTTREQSWECFYHALIAFKTRLTEQAIFLQYEQDYTNLALHVALWNLNTLTYPMQEICYNTLKMVGFEKLGIIDHEEAYFFNKKEYRQLQTIMMQPYDKAFPHAKNDHEARFNGGLLDNIGRVLRSTMQCCREHGLKYTIKTFTRRLSDH